MAGELRGAVLEALVYLAAEQISTSTKLVPEWGTTKVPWSSVVPDVVLYDATKSARVLILVTATDSSSDANRKFWRNFIELADSKTAKGSNFVVMDVTVERTEKHMYENVRDFIFDARVLPTNDVERDSFFELANFVEKQVPSKASPSDCLKALKGLAGKMCSARDLLVSSFSKQIETGAKANNSRLKTLWNSIQKTFDRTPFPKVPKSQLTNLTRGVGKSLLLTAVERGQLFKSRPSKSRLAQELQDLGITRRTLKGTALQDSEIKECLGLFGADVIEQVIAHTPEKKYAVYVEQVRNISVYTTSIEHIRANVKNLSKPKFLESEIAKIANSPGHNWPNSNTTPNFHWLLETLIAVERIQLKNKMAAFYNDIEQRCQIPKSVQRYHYPRAIRFESELPDELLKAISEHFANFLKTCDKKTFASAAEKIKVSIKQNVMECKLIPHGARPLQAMLQITMKGSPYENCKPNPIGCFLAKQAYFLSTEGFVFDDKIVITKSATEKGRTHKVKELKSKLLALSIEISSSGKFRRIEKKREIALLLDGTFDDDDLADFIRCGATRVFYANQMQEFRDWIMG